jgi:membrane protein implicated in regulation of membrane protease activity
MRTWPYFAVGAASVPLSIAVLGTPWWLAVLNAYAVAAAVAWWADRRRARTPQKARRP